MLKPKLNRSWYSAVKLETIFNYIKSGSCKTEYIMYCDSDDVILRNDPKKAIQFLRKKTVTYCFPEQSVRTDMNVCPR